MKKEKWNDGWKLIKPGQTPIMAAMMGDAGRLGRSGDMVEEMKRWRSLFFDESNLYSSLGTCIQATIARKQIKKRHGEAA